VDGFEFGEKSDGGKQNGIFVVQKKGLWKVRASEYRATRRFKQGKSSDDWGREHGEQSALPLLGFL
jgi:hypothetical protein